MKKTFGAMLAIAGFLSVTNAFGQTQQEWDTPHAIPVDSARVEIKKQIEISVDVPGTLITLTPNERGEIVEKGQVIVEVNKELPEAELAELVQKAEASDILIDFAVNTLQVEELRLQDMKDRNEQAGSKVFTDTELREQDLAVIKANAELKKAHKDKEGLELAAKTKEISLKQYTRIAEFGGIVVDLHKKAVGASVRQGDPIMTIVNFEEMLVTLTVNPIYKPRINVGDKVFVRPLALSLDGISKSGGAADSPFKTSQNETPRQTITTSLPQQSTLDEICVGRVTFVGAKRKSDAENSFLVECVVKNKAEGIAKYLLNEGSIVDAIILAP